MHPIIGSWGSTVLVTIINYLIPWILQIITHFEEWDFSSTVSKNEVWRSYLAGILNNIIFALVYAEVILDTPLFRSKSLTEY